MPVATEAPTKQDIERLKDEIRELLPNYQTRRYELGLRLLLLRDMLAHHGNGTFRKVTTGELKIPHSTVYDLIDYAEAETKRLKGLSGNRTNSDDTDVDFGDPEEVADLIRRFEEQAHQENELHGKSRDRRGRKEKSYIKMVQLKFIFSDTTRKRVARSWQILRTDEVELKKTSLRIAREVIRAASRVKKATERAARSGVA